MARMTKSTGMGRGGKRKGGGRKKLAKAKKPTGVTVYLTPAESRDVAKAAARQSLPVSSYIRQALGFEPLQTIDTDEG